MNRSSISFLLGGALLAGCASEALGEDTVLRPGSQVRVFAGGAREIPGAILLTSRGVTTPGAIVAQDSKLVAVQLPDEAVPVALPRPGARPVGRLVSFDEDGVIVRFEGQNVPYRVPRDVITALEVNRAGRRNVLKSTGIGLAVGALAGVAVGILSGDDDPRQFFAFSAGEKAAIAGVALGGAGAVVGFFAGLAPRRPSWERIELGRRHVGLFVEPRRDGAGAGLRVSF